MIKLSGKRVLLKDIAEKAGLTINTVSRALKDKDDISVHTRQHVQSLALEMGYIKDFVASSLRSGKTSTIGVMFDNIANPYYMIMTDLIHQKLQVLGYDMMIFTSSGDKAQFDVESFNKMIARRIDGIITFLKPTPDVAKLIKINRLPLVILGREGDDIGIDSVYTNDLLGVYKVGKYLTEKGHTKIGYIGAPRDIICSRKRAEGLIKYLKETNRELNDNNIVFLDHGDMNLTEPLGKLVNQGVTAIFCFNDTMAYEILSILKRKVINTNTKIAIVGYDNTEDFLRVPVGLTSVDCSKDELAEKAIKSLFSRIENPDLPLIVVVEETNIIERTTA